MLIVWLMFLRLQWSFFFFFILALRSCCTTRNEATASTHKQNSMYFAEVQLMTELYLIARMCFDLSGDSVEGADKGNNGSSDLITGSTCRPWTKRHLQHHTTQHPPVRQLFQKGSFLCCYIWSLSNVLNWLSCSWDRCVDFCVQTMFIFNIFEALSPRCCWWGVKKIDIQQRLSIVVIKLFLQQRFC